MAAEAGNPPSARAMRGTARAHHTVGLRVWVGGWSCGPAVARHAAHHAGHTRCHRSAVTTAAVPATTTRVTAAVAHIWPQNYTYTAKDLGTFFGNPSYFAMAGLAGSVTFG